MDPVSDAVGAPRRAANGIADLTRGWGIGLRGDDLACLARLLGFEQRETPSVSEKPPAPSATRPARPEPPPPAPSRPRAPSPGTPLSSPEAPPQEPVATQVEELPPLPPPRVESPRTVAALLPPVRAGRSIRHHDLLLPRRRRGVLGEMAATFEACGALDLERALATVAEGRALRRLPRELRSTTRRGAQLLVDLGEGMEPFRTDTRKLLGDFASVLGSEGVQQLFFAGLPTRGAGPGALSTWKPYELPKRGRSILLVSDLGLSPVGHSAHRATTREWSEFFDDLRSAGFAPLALVPFPARRWPPELCRKAALVHWDRRTTAAGVRRALRRIRRPGPTR